MKIARDTVDFNKEIIFGEIGAVLGAPASSFIISRFTSSVNVISYSAVIGAIIGAAIVWIATRVYDQLKMHKLSTKKFFGDIAFLTPVAFALTLLIYYPTLFLMSKYMLLSENKVIFSVILAQLIAFALFLTAINLYRYILLKITGRRI
ncbi:MAG: hypothetical protein QXD13_02600 [Candidatus Pacearchaeota archaeon]